MDKGISNLQIEKFFHNEQNEDLRKSYLGIYSMDSITRYINFYEIIKKRCAKYPFAIFKTDRHNQPGTHWWSFMDIHPKKNLMLFYSLGLDGFKFFIADNDEKIIDELHFIFKKCKISLTDQKITLHEMKLFVDSWENMTHTKKEQLAETAQNFFHLLQQFPKLKKTNEMSILILENPIQDLTSSICGIFQLYFYKDLFDPDKKSKVTDHENLNKHTIEVIFNKFFSTDVDENEHLIKKFKEEYNLYKT